MLENLNAQQRHEAAADCWSRFNSEVNSIFSNKLDEPNITKEQMLEKVRDCVNKYQDEMADYLPQLEIEQLPFSEAEEFLRTNFLTNACVKWLEQHNKQQ